MGRQPHRNPPETLVSAWVHLIRSASILVPYKVLLGSEKLSFARKSIDAIRWKERSRPPMDNFSDNKFKCDLLRIKSPMDWEEDKTVTCFSLGGCESREKIQDSSLSASRQTDKIWILLYRSSTSGLPGSYKGTLLIVFLRWSIHARSTSHSHRFSIGY